MQHRFKRRMAGLITRTDNYPCSAGGIKGPIQALLLPFLLALTLSGCATGPTLNQESLASLSSQQQLGEVPFYSQRDYQCGPATLAMMLEAGGQPVAVDTLIPQVFLPDREGSVQPEMLATARRQGLIPYVIAGDFNALLIELDAGNPVAVMQNLSLPVFPMWHYAVAIGYDVPGRQLTLHSGMEPARQVAFDRFDATWARSQRWAFVALPPGQLPASMPAGALVQPISDFELVAGTTQALAAWQAAAQQYPDHAMLKFALGNALYTSDDTQGAIKAFGHATVLDPTLAEAWLNLGLLLKENEPQEALEALGKAAELKGPWQVQAKLAIEALAGNRR